MAVFVVDASVSLAWCFADEATDWTKGLLTQLLGAGHAVVPAHWQAEVVNGLLMAVRKRRIERSETRTLWNQIASLPIAAEPSLSPTDVLAVLSLGERYRLTAYDAAYLELARSRNLPLATLDNDLRRAAASEGVVLL